LRLVSGAIRVVAVAVGMFLAVIYLKLGYFVLFLLPLGALTAVVLTRAQRAGYSQVWSSLVAIVTYGAAYAVVSSAAIRNRDETRDLTWEVLEPPSQTRPEVRLYVGAAITCPRTPLNLQATFDHDPTRPSPFPSPLREFWVAFKALALPASRVGGSCHSVGTGPPEPAPGGNIGGVLETAI